MARLLALLLLLLPSAAGAQTVADRLRHAAIAGDGVDRLVAAHRLAVKPVVQELVRVSAAATLAGRPDSARAASSAAARLASAFQAAFGEASLSLVVESLGRWDAEQLRSKLAADSLLAAGVAVRQQQPETARGLFAAALEAYRGIGDRHGEAETLGQIGYVTWFLERPAYVERNLEALAARRAVDDRQLVGNTLNDLGLGYRDVEKNLPKALEAYRESEAVRRAIGDTLALSRLLPNMGRVFEGLGDFSAARAYYLDGGAMYLAVGDTARWIGQMSNTAGLLTDYADRHAEALAILLSLDRALDRSGDARARAVVLSNAGIIRRRLGDFEGAVEAYREAIRLSEENGFDDLLAKAYNNLGVLYIFLSRSDRAVPILERALGRTAADDHDGRADALLSLSSAHFQQRDYERARYYSARADSVAADPVRRAKAVKMRADIELRDGEPEAAIPAFRELLALGTRLEVPMLVSDGHFGLAEAYERSGRATEAVTAYDEALQTLESARGRLYTQEDKAGYLAQSRYLYEEVLHFLTRQAIGEAPVGQVSPGQRPRFAEKAFEVAERGKARAFLDQMAEALAGVREGVDPGLQEDLEALSRNMTTLREQLAAADPDSQATEIAELKGLVASMETEYERVEREMRAQNPRFAAMRYPDPVTLSELRAEVLRPGELLLQYSLGDSSSTLWAVTRDGFSIHRLPVRSEIEGQVQVLRAALEIPDDASLERFALPARALFDGLLGPVAGLLAGADELTVVPDGALSYLPFEVLLSGPAGADFRSAPYLVRQVPIAYVQSASVLRQLRREVTPEFTHQLLAVGDPMFSDGGELGDLRGRGLSRLPFTGAEVSAIGGLFEPASQVVLMEDEASEARVRESLAGRKYRYVHFATHGLVDDDRPDNSALALAGTGGDALLEVKEIFNLDVDAELVVLSACETGLGQLVKGEGVVGLTRAFMYAGAPAVVVSLWSVSDRSTSTLMRGFYRNLVTRTGIDRSLQAAKLALLESAETAHPFHWAPFVLVGKGE